jgi:hypothetical protein
MSRDVKRWVGACVKCNKVKTTQQLSNGLLEPIVTKQPFEIVGVDILGPFVTSSDGYSHVLVCVDLFTSWVEAVPLKEITEKEVCAAFFKFIISRHRCPNLWSRSNTTC